MEHRVFLYRCELIYVHTEKDRSYKKKMMIEGL